SIALHDKIRMAVAYCQLSDMVALAQADFAITVATRVARDCPEENRIVAVQMVFLTVKHIDLLFECFGLNQKISPLPGQLQVVGLHLINTSETRTSDFRIRSFGNQVRIGTIVSFGG